MLPMPTTPLSQDNSSRSPREDDLAALREVAVGVAYRMVGSRAEAEDLAQETLVRVYAATEREDIRRLEAFTTTVATRLALDHLRSARVRREAYVGPWLPEPVLGDPLVTGRAGDATGGPFDDPASTAEMADTLSFAFLVVLESLGPVERAAFLLHDVFDFGYPEIAETLDRSEAACRQIVARARQRVDDARPRFPVDPDRHRRLLELFLEAARLGDVDRLAALLSKDAVLVSDGGASRRAARHPIQGRERVVRFLRTTGPSLLASGRDDVGIELASLNGEPGFVVRIAGEAYLAGTIEVGAGGRIAAVRWVLNPDKLGWVPAT